MVHLAIAGAHTRLLSPLCARCPQGPTGCCVGPPDLDWSDVGRIVSLGGRGWVLEQLAAGNLSPRAHGLSTRRVRRRSSPTEPRHARCVYHGPNGCTVAPELRAATCNYFVCDDAFTSLDPSGDPAEIEARPDEGAGDGPSARARHAHGVLSALYRRWDVELAGCIAVYWPGAPPWNGAFLDWLGLRFERLAGASRPELESLARAPTSAPLPPPAASAQAHADACRSTV